jgi:hypothetical protein
MTNAEKIAIVNGWQNDPRVHPLTCGHNTAHRPLVAREEGGTVVLACQDCAYTQTHIPDLVLAHAPLQRDPEELANASRNLKAQFDDAHAKGMAALKDGDYKALGEAIDRERAITEEQATLIPAPDATKQPPGKK